MEKATTSIALPISNTAIATSYIATFILPHSTSKTPLFTILVIVCVIHLNAGIKSSPISNATAVIADNSLSKSPIKLSSNVSLNLLAAPFEFSNPSVKILYYILVTSYYS